jgi:uncharacterized protein YaaR (DUF327 family)
MNDKQLKLKWAKQKFNRVNNRFYTAVSIMEEALNELPDKGNTEKESQKITILNKIKDVEHALTGLCIEDFLS